MRLYKEAFKEASSEIEIERSKFIAHVKPVSSREEAEEFFTKIRKEYRDATHNVPCLVLGDKFQLQWASDDGEPQGTSGAPMVQLLVSNQITNTAVIVTRYFGGIKLGTGGLVRAYTSALKAGLESSGLAEIKKVHMIKAKYDYSCLAKLSNYGEKGLFKIDDIIYEDVVTVSLTCEIDDTLKVHNILSDLSSGKYQIILEDDILKKEVI